MLERGWKWAKSQNLYVLAFVLGVLGLVDALAPGSRTARLEGVAIALVAAYMWLLQ